MVCYHLYSFCFFLNFRFYFIHCYPTLCLAIVLAKHVRCEEVESIYTPAILSTILNAVRTLVPQEKQKLLEDFQSLQLSRSLSQPLPSASRVNQQNNLHGGPANVLMQKSALARQLRSAQSCRLVVGMLKCYILA